MSDQTQANLIERWAVAALPIAVLLTGDQQAAERATIDAVAVAVAQHNEEALWPALLRHAPGRLRAAIPHRALPRPLRRIAPLDRALLGLWLLRGWDGSRIAAVAGIAPDALLPRLQNAISRLSPDTPLDNPDESARWNEFVARQLGFAPPALSQRTPPAWTAALDDVRTLLRDAVAQQRPSPALLAAIAEGVDEDEQRPAWQRFAPWLLPLLGGALLVALLVVPGGDTSVLPQSPPTARELVEESLSMWLTKPVSGTLHRRAVAYDEHLLIDEPLTTDVWLSAGSERHRIEVRHGDRLVEWQIGDGKSRFDHATIPSYSSCRWTQNGIILDDVSRTFDILAEQQQAARIARLQLGAYGEGYHALDRARNAPDLRSFGIRTENNTPRLLLGYTDRRPPERTILLSIDPQTSQLWAVREVTSAGSQASMRDLWRLETEETSQQPVSITSPEWSRISFVRDRLVDPACPGLDVNRVLSLRRLPIGINSYGISWLPPSLPPGITKAALISSSVLTIAGFGAPQDVQAIFYSPDRWLSMQQSGRSDLAHPTDQPNKWSVSFRDPSPSGTIDALATRTSSDPSRFMPAYRITARGWTQEEVIEFVESLEPINPRTWIELGDSFLDPQPLDQPVTDVLRRAIDALEPRAGTLHATFTTTNDYDRDLPARNDPYSLPPDVLYPQQYITESWRVVSGTQVIQTKDVRRTGSTLLSTGYNDGSRFGNYNANVGQAFIGDSMMFAPDGHLGTDAHTMIGQLLHASTPITLTERANSWLLEQPAPEQARVPEIAELINRQDGDIRPASDHLIRRVWLDRDTYLPRRMELAYNVAPFTTLYTIERTAWEWIDTPPDDFWQLPPLPPETLTLSPQADGGGEQIVKSDLQLVLPRRVLVWPSGADVVAESISEAIEIPSTPTLEEIVVSEQLRDHLWTTFTEFSVSSSLVTTTRYHFAGQDVPVVIRQGPRDILRYMLRHDMWKQNMSLERNTSTRLTAMIDGQMREAWLIETGTQSVLDSFTALIVEADDVLLHISGPSADELRDVTLPALKQLEWQDVPVAGPYIQTDSHLRTITPPPVVPTAVPSP